MVGCAVCGPWAAAASKFSVRSRSIATFASTGLRYQIVGKTTLARKSSEVATYSS